MRLWSSLAPRYLWAVLGDSQPGMGMKHARFMRPIRRNMFPTPHEHTNYADVLVEEQPKTYSGLVVASTGAGPDAMSSYASSSSTAGCVPVLVASRSIGSYIASRVAATSSASASGAA